MPGYVFVKMAHGYAARGVTQVFGVVSMDGEPMPIPESDIAQLMRARIVNGDDRRADPVEEPDLIGDSVRELARRICQFEVVPV